ncbi:MAG TPA: C25 family cysteine peptidase [Desulfatiglandales bacterium]|nr:C25 family cysteine peptidase [Desulfatiglandales bacterium]
MTTQYFSTVSSPAGNDWSFSGGTAIPVTTSSASFRVLFTAKSHAALAAGTYAVTGTVTSYTCTNSQAGTDTDSATITVDNSPPANATWGTITPGDEQIQLNWSNPISDFYRVVILRRAGAAVGDAPTDGTEYNVNETIGSSTVRYVGSLETFTDTGLTNGTAYYYKIFAYDTYINYASGAGTGPHTPAEASATTNYRSIGTSTADFKTGTPNITISSGTATLTVDQTGNIGVGDKIDYDTDNKIAYITAKQSNKVFTVQTEAGGTPVDVSDLTVNSIKRAYNTLQDWEDPLDPDGGRGGNLVNDNRVEVGVCYKDGAFTSTGSLVLYITGNTTDSTHYLELTVAEGNRHDGTAGATGTSNAMIDGENGGRKGINIVNGQDVRIKWLELKNFSGVNYANPIEINAGNSVQFEYLLIHDFINGTLADSNNSFGIKLSGSGGNTVTVRNCIFYNGDVAGITGDETNDTITIENCTVYGILGHGINRESSNVVVKNTICVHNGVGESGYHDFTNSPTMEYCISEDDRADCATCMAGRTPTANGDPGTGNWVIFNNISAGTEDFHLQYHATENDALDKAPPLSFTDDIDGETRPTSALSWDIGADEYIGAAVTTNYRSIGTNTGTVYSTGTASICSGDTVVQFSSGASLPACTAVGAVGLGDKLTIGSETFYILSRDSATQVTVQSAATADHETEGYTIERSYNTIQAWEDPLDPDLGRGGNLVSENRREVGVCYKDGAFSLTTGVVFDGSTTDTDHYMHLTVAEGQRHNGRAGTGVVVDAVGITSGSAEKNAFHVRDQYVRIEWLEIKNLDGTLNGAGQPINLSEGNAGNNLLSKLMIHDYTSTLRGAINVYENATVRNCIFYNGDVGIRTYSNPNLTLTLENVTIYGMTGTGVNHDKGKLIVKNTISVGSGNSRDFDLDNEDPVDGSSGYNMYGTVHNDIHPGATSGLVSISFDGPTKTITRSTGSFSTDGFVIGNTIRTDSGTNPGPFTITNVTALVITVSEAVTTEAAASRNVYLDVASVNKRTPPGDLDDLFYSITDGYEDLHIHSSGHLALNEGQDLSSSFTDDIDGDTRPTGANTWDIGADEHSTPATGIYVDGNLGNDTTGDGSWDKPYKTIQYAENEPPSPGETIYIRGGITYDENELVVNVSGTSGNEITFTKWPGPESNPVISSSAEDAIDIRSNYIIFDSIDATTAGDDGYDTDGQNVTIRNCSIYNSPATPAGDGICVSENSSGTTIDNCKIYNNTGRGIQLMANGGGLTVSNCEIYGNVNYGGIDINTTTTETILIEYNTIYNHTDAGDGFGIDLGCNGATVRYNKIYGNYCENLYVGGDGNVIHHNLIYNSTGSDGIELQDQTTGTQNNIIYNNTIDGNAANGINLNYAGSGNIIINNIISNNGGVGIIDDDNTNEPDDSYNCVYNNTGGNFDSLDPASGGTGTITSDPLYVDRDGADNTLGTADDDFHLQSTWGYFPFGSGCVESASDSPCIDAGAPSGDYSAYSNEPEGNGDQVNMGAYGNSIEASKSGAATAISLLSFTATGDGPSVLVAWETAQEIDNMGFYLYRATSRGGPYTRLTDKLIPGLFSSVLGKEYSYEDTDVTPGKLYYYKLEDLDAHGISTFHGPICVDWDGDGLPDDWEIAHGLNPGVNDAYLDSDFDGLTNLEEYEMGTDPLNPDTDGDGILDGDEGWRRDRDTTGRILGKGVEILASDETGMTLELVTDAFDMEIVEGEGEAYERLRILDYIHGYIPHVGRPELPLKGILLDLPSGKSATLTVEDVKSETYSGYLIYPVPENAVSDEGALSHVGEVFAQDEATYSTDALYPDVVSATGKIYTFRDQQKLQVLFYPFAFNPVTRELKHYTRIRVRLTFEDTMEAARAGNFLVGAAVEPPELTGAAWSPPSEDTVYKVLVSGEGIYRITSGSGLDVDGMDLSQVRLYNLGQEVAISVYDGDGDDYIEFYGRPVNAAYAKYTKYNVYWLTTSGGVGEPKRMTTINGTPESGDMATSHTDTVTYELDQRYWIGAPGDDSLDRWFFNGMLLGDEVEWGGNLVNVTFAIPGAIDTGDLTISLSGYYDTDHEVSVSLNGSPVGTLTWSGITAYEGTISPVMLQDGNNTVTLRCESGLDIIYVDKFMVTYPRSFAAHNDELIFIHDAGHHYQITGFTSNDLLVYDITESGDVAQVVNSKITKPPGPYTLEFELPEEVSERTYYALADGMVKTPAGITQDVAASLADPANSADYILITHRDLGWDGNGHPYPWLDPLGDETSSLVTLRQNQGLRVIVADVQDIYDEFTYGIVTPQAIKDFISYAYANWIAPAPQYVLLVGDSNFDCKDNLEKGNVNLVPAYLTFTEYMGEAPTDEWFVKVSGEDAVPDLYIGRLPAASADEASVMVNKIITYETSPNTKTWEKNVLLVADNETEGDEYEADFELMSEDVAALIPTAMSEPFKGYLGDYGAAGPLTADIKEEINRGTLIVNYSGHGSTQIWADEHIFDADDVPDLTNDDELVFLINMTCLTGYFAYPELGFLHEPSLMETLLRPEGKGAVAAFMPVGMTTTDGQRILDSALFEAIFTDDIRTLGPAIHEAKQTLLANGAQYEEMSETFLLFGDPAMTLKVPLPRRPTGVSIESTDQGILITWNAATDCNGNPVSGYNVYRSTSAGGPYEKINVSLITGTEYTDTSGESGTTYYYVVRSVDADGDESAQTLQLSALAGIGTGDGAPSTGSGCFISTAGGGSQ